MSNFSIKVISVLVSCFLMGGTALSDEKKIPNTPLTKAEIQKCKEDGGVVKNVGLMEIPKCVIPYKDAGKVCKSSSECSASCVVMKSNIPMGTKISGECQHDNALYGCYVLVEDGVAGPRMCSD